MDLNKVVLIGNAAPKVARDADKEIWKDIPEYSGYRLSNRGRVAHITYLKPYKERVVLTKDGKQHFFSIKHLLNLLFA